MNRMNSLKKGLRQVACLMSRYQVELLPRMLCAVLQTRSVNLQQWAAVLAGSAQIASHYRRLQRFLSGTWSPQVATQLIVQQLVKPGKPILLTLDRTHWQYGQTHHNLLCLGLVHQRVSIPLEYVALGRAGNSSNQRHVLDAICRRSGVVCWPTASLSAAPGCGICWSARYFVIRLRCRSQPRFMARSTRNLTKVYQQVPTTPSLFILYVIGPTTDNGSFWRSDFVDGSRCIKWAAETAFGFLKKALIWKPPACAHPSGLRLVGLMDPLRWRASTPTKAATQQKAWLSRTQPLPERTRCHTTPHRPAKTTHHSTIIQHYTIRGVV